MTDFFKSALGIFGNQNAGPSSMAGPGSSTFTTNNDFVGQTIMVGNLRLRVTKMLAEGGYAIVYIAQDISSGQEYALKRIFSADESSNHAIKQEISYLKQLANHPNIINFIAAACEESQNSRSKEYLILTELCKDPLIDHLRAGLNLPSGFAFNFEQVLQIFYQICRSVQYLHTQEPPITHRDLKLENFLVSRNNEIKLCDFGSATTQVYHPDNSWSVNKRNLVEDEIAKQTTPMYRAPEMLDLYNNFKIDSQSDIWALGCVLYLLCFNRHPFEDGAKLRIINGKYQIPANDRDFVDFHDLIRLMLNTDPNKRPNVNEIMFHLENISQTKSVPLGESLNFLKKTESLLHAPSISPVSNQIQQQQQQHQQQSTQQNNNWGSSLFKGSSILKTIKDASSKVMDSVQNSINRTDLDLSYITSRLIVMSCPTEGIESAAFGNNIDLIKETIESKHGRNYRIYNLANKTYRKEKFSQVIDLGAQLSTSRAPPVTLMIKLAANVNKFLSENEKNICVINCNDGKSISAIAICTIMMYFGLIKSVDSCLNLFHVKRGFNVQMTPCQYKYLVDTQKLFATARSEVPKPFVTNSNECLLLNVILVGCPMFNRARNGCTPFIEVYIKDKKIYTNIQDYDLLKKYSIKDTYIQIPINCHKFYGDILVMVFHAKSLLGTEKVMTTKVCQFQFHTSFAYNDLNSNNQLKFTRNELDCLDAPDKYPDSFHVLATIEYKNIESPIASEDPWNNTLEFESQIRKIQKNLLFHDQDEMNQLIKVYDSQKYSDSRQTPNINIFQAEDTNVPENFSDTDGYDQLGGSHHSGYSSRSSRSTSPVVKTQQQEHSEPKVANLLDFDDFGNDTQEFQESNKKTVQTPQTSLPETKLVNDFDMLLDLGSTQQNQNNSNSNNFFDPFASSSIQNSNDSNLLMFDSFQAVPEPKKPSPPNNLFDPFGNFDVNSSSTKNANNNSSNSPSFPKLDPFADLNTFSNTSQNSKPQFMSQTSGKTPSPTKDFFGSKPNYSTAAFSTFSNPNPATTQVPKSTGLGPKNSSAVFDEFLPSNFTKSQNSKNMTLKDLKREQDVKEIDPDKLKVIEWTDGKRANIRALLCSLHKVLWDGESRWKPVGMNQLVSGSDVKKAYHKACLCVHPDKMTDHPQHNLAKLIFVELNDAWAQFQKDGQQNLF